MPIKLPEFREDQLLTLDDVREIVAAIRAIEPRAVEGGGLLAYETSAGRYLRLATPGTSMRYALSPTGGIAAPTFDGTDITPTTASCRLFDKTTTGWRISSTSVTVYHGLVGAAVGASKIIIISSFEGRWNVIAEACTSNTVPPPGSGAGTGTGTGVGLGSGPGLMLGGSMFGGNLKNNTTTNRIPIGTGTGAGGGAAPPPAPPPP